ncbi:Chimeric ERCC6-PGBD3 protein [Eumeta japonica]|uniref:Chimeric ERCC6-PGBD3 protein n=1 Tax=Eumeta variegata TaxID=151549 RepID=A0A4C1UXA1_EUMVA|nr:Chimeric ERCC6-PGBD3 protein [Eumeta japonica]
MDLVLAMNPPKWMRHHRLSQQHLGAGFPLEADRAGTRQEQEVQGDLREEDRQEEEEGQVRECGDTMTRERFLTLRNALHVVDSDTLEEAEKNKALLKVQPIINKVKETCNRLERTPGYYSIDKQMIPFTGRCKPRQIVKNKPRPMARSEMQQFVCNDIAIVEWKDNKSVLMASNYTGVGEATQVKRWDKKTKTVGDRLLLVQAFDRNYER